MKTLWLLTLVSACLLTSNLKAQEVPFKVVKSAYFAHNYIDEISYFTFENLEEFNGKMGFACMGNCQDDLKTALKAEDFKDNFVIAIVHPNVAPHSSIQIISLERDSQEDLQLQYSFSQGETSSYKINALEIILVPRQNYKSLVVVKK